MPAVTVGTDETWNAEALGVSGLLLAEPTRPFFSTAASCRSRSTAILPIS